jgi:hypothetical protein
MKRVIHILILALFLPLALQAQTKKIIMIEPLEEDSMMHKNIIRIKLAEAFSNSEKYKSLIKGNIDLAMIEFDFQNIGILNDEQRKSLEKMSGAELMCITLITNENDYTFVECRLIELKNGKTVKIASQLMKNTTEAELEKGCLLLATKLAGRIGRRNIADTKSGDKRRNGEIYNPDGIELVYVAGSGRRGIMANNAFYIGKYEVTQAQWKAIMGSNPSHFKGDQLPVENVSWDDVQVFLKRLNEKTGNYYRLPTEAEWEFAAGGGTAKKTCPGGCNYSGGNRINSVAWYKKNSSNRTHPVGTKAPNELGIYDMSGNVWEWCENWYDSSHQHRSVRGGSWFRDAECSNVSFRAHDHQSIRSYNIGFRVVLPM